MTSISYNVDIAINCLKPNDVSNCLDVAELNNPEFCATVIQRITHSAKLCKEKRRGKLELRITFHP